MFRLALLLFAFSRLLLLNLSAFPRRRLLNLSALSRLPLLNLPSFPLLLLYPGILPAGISLRLLLLPSAILRLNISSRPVRLWGILSPASLWRRVFLRRYPGLLPVKTSTIVI